jgi:PAS domain S-box-containing protein
MTNTAYQEKHEPSSEVFDNLQKAFLDFQLRAEKLDVAYATMRRDFKKVNLELDKKNIQLAESLKKQEEVQIYLNSILESMNNGVIGINTLGMITHFNRAAAEITGFSRDEAIGKPYKDVFFRSICDASNLFDVLHSGKEQTRDEKAMWRKDGYPVPVWFQTALLKDPKGHAIGAVEIFSDISRLKALEEQVQHTKTMAALGEMAATVAHEIRNPLGAMGMWAALLERDLEPKDERKKLVNRILEGLSRLNRIVSNLLVYSRPVKARFRSISLVQVLNETLDFVEIEAERKGHPVRVHKNLNNEESCHVMADPEKIQQVVMNLCINAIQAMPSGGDLKVSIDKIKKQSADFTSFCIADTGMGISDENIDKIFDPFYTTKENGTGLGLAIVKKIVESHSGFITVSSIVDEGTTVNVYLPSAPVQAEN